MKIPQFLYVPRLNTLGTSTESVKLVVESRNNIIWQIFEFENYLKTVEFVQTKEEYLAKNGAVSIAVHKQFPVVLVCIKSNKVKMERLVKLGTMACDWYIQFYLDENKGVTSQEINKKNKKVNYD